MLSEDELLIVALKAKCESLLEQRRLLIDDIVKQQKEIDQLKSDLEAWKCYSYKQNGIVT